MEKLGGLLGGIEKKVQALLLKIKLLNEQNLILKQREKDLEKQVSSLKEQMEGLENKLKIITIAKTIEGGPQKKELKLKVNQMLREVDKCIALLNK